MFDSGTKEFLHKFISLIHTKDKSNYYVLI